MEGPKRSELRTPERPLVWISHKDGEQCTVCGTELRSGNFIQIARDTGIRCLTCAGLSDLIFLGSGDAALTRRAVAFSSKNAVVVKFSRARKRHVSTVKRIHRPCRARSLSLRRVPRRSTRKPAKRSGPCNSSRGAMRRTGNNGGWSDSPSLAPNSSSRAAM